MRQRTNVAAPPSTTTLGAKLDGGVRKSQSSNDVTPPECRRFGKSTPQILAWALPGISIVVVADAEYATFTAAPTGSARIVRPLSSVNGG